MTRVQRFDPAFLQYSSNTVICGDINGHAPSWDALANPNEIGEDVEDWAFTNGFFPANSGESTRVDPHSGAETAPDISLLHNNWSADEYKWRLVDASPSDHKPILITLTTKCTRQPVRNRRTPWAFTKADWGAFADKLDIELAQLNLHEAWSAAVLTAAKKAIPQGERAKPKAWWNAEAEDAVQRYKVAQSQAHLDDAHRAAALVQKRQMRNTIMSLK